MKKLLTLLTTLLLLFAFSPRVMASKTVYLLTGQEGNGVKGDWSNKFEAHRLTQVAGTEEYYIKLTSTDQEDIYFGFNVIGDDQYRPETDRLQLTVGGAKTNVHKGNNSHAWLLKFNKSEYDYIVLHISFGANASEHRVWADQNGGTTTPTVPSYYLIGKLLNNSWSERNEDGYKFETTDNVNYSYTVDNPSESYDFRFRIGTNGNTKATAYHPKTTPWSFITKIKDNMEH